MHSHHSMLTVTFLHVRHVFNHSHLMITIKLMQVLYSPRQCEGLGLSDGEVMERLWSYLRRFSRMTKEMRPAHRLDVLSHALLYYASTSKQKLRKL